MLTKPNILRLIFFLAAFAGALYYPVSTILAFECPSTPPEEFRFRVQGYDPYDPMRGHYLELMLPSTLPAEEKPQRFSGGRAVALLNRDEAGFSVVSKLLPESAPIPAGRPYIKVDRVYYYSSIRNGKAGLYRFRLPFHRYYINERLAEDAEALLKNITRSKKHSAVLVVDVYPGGIFTVTDLLIDGKPIAEVLDRAAARSR